MVKKMPPKTRNNAALIAAQINQKTPDPKPQSISKVVEYIENGKERSPAVLSSLYGEGRRLKRLLSE